MIKFNRLVCGLGFVLMSANVHAQFGNYLNQAEDALNGKKNNNSNSNNKSNNSAFSNLSSSDIASGLKEALQVGAKNAGAQLSSMNGYFGNPLIKIPMPPEAAKVETALRDMGLGKQVDDAILSMNRAAEDAAMKSVPIFINAITSITIQDGLAILQGGNDAATQYLKAKTTAALTAAYMPVIKTSLDKVNATKYWADIFNTYNKLPLAFNKVNPDLPSYVTERALNGLFVTIAQEEAKIRQNPAARVNDILKKVFGAH